MKKSKKDRKGAGARKKVVEEEEDEDVELEPQPVPSAPVPIEDSTGAPVKATPVTAHSPSPPNTQSTAAAQRETAQRERDRLNIALGRAQADPKLTRRELLPTTTPTSRAAPPLAANGGGGAVAGSRIAPEVLLGSSNGTGGSTSNGAVGGIVNVLAPGMAMNMGVSVTAPVAHVISGNAAPGVLLQQSQGYRTGQLNGGGVAGVGGAGLPANGGLGMGFGSNGGPAPGVGMLSDAVQGSSSLGVGAVRGGEQQPGGSGDDSAAEGAPVQRTDALSTFPRTAQQIGDLRWSHNTTSSDRERDRSTPTSQSSSVQLQPQPAKSCKFCAFCKERARTAPFHWCVDDRIVIGFRGPSPAGAISRPCSAVQASA